MFEFEDSKYPGNVSRRVDFGFYVQFPSIGGYTSRVVSKEQYEKFKRNPVDVVAEIFGVSVSDYWEWFDAQGYVRCSATNKNGKQCKCSIPGKFECTEWAEKRKNGGYCVKHGG